MGELTHSEESIVQHTWIYGSRLEIVYASARVKYNLCVVEPTGDDSSSSFDTFLIIYDLQKIGQALNGDRRTETKVQKSFASKTDRRYCQGR